MNTHETRRIGFLRRRKLHLALALTAGLVACASFVPRQGWSPGLGPVVPHDSFPTDCALCHIAGNWHTIKDDFVFDHNVETGVALLGAHESVSCLLCHNDRGPVSFFATQGCTGCHIDVHRGKLGRDCTDCHGETTWVPKDAIVRHNLTRFPLIGAHTAVACYRCHAGAQVGNFEGLDPVCATCHASDVARVTSPDHVAQGWTQNCQDCHGQLGWVPALFGHPASFPLSGGHGGIACDVCHIGNVFTALPTECVSCHLGDYQQTTNPNHITAGFSTDCAACHGISSWRGAAFNHPGTFPLSGGHAGQLCSACHVGGVFMGLSTDCVSCHLSDYQQTTNPPHQASGFGTDCASCHTINAWGSGTFNHPNTFPLTGGHAGQPCSACHVGGFPGLSTECVSCHLDDYNGTTNPDHQAAGFSTDCTLCHNTSSWPGAVFDHSFPLTGPHNRDCSECHLNPGNPTQFSCTHCHEHRQSAMDKEHSGVSGYVWSSPACLACHPNGTG